jgi:predicted branched-subunit amino acid permease
MQVIFTRDGIRRGAITTLPVTLAMVPFALVIGVLGASKGLSALENGLMSALVFAGASQLLALELWADPAPVLAAALAAFVVNIRMAPMGAALAPWLDRLRGIRVWGTLATLVDHSFALSVAEQRAGGRDAGFLLGAGLVMWVCWVSLVLVGHLAGATLGLPPGHAFYFASVACFVSILVSLWRGPGRDLAPWALAAGVALLLPRLGLPAPLPLLGAAFAGAALGAWLELRRERAR